MRVKCTISPINITGTSLYLPGAYRYKGIMRVLTETDDVIDFNGDPKNMPKAKGFYTSKVKPNLVIEYEDNEKLSENPRQDRINKKICEVFYANHIQFTKNGKKHENTMPNPIWNIQFSTDVLAEKHANFRDKQLVRNRIHAMSLEEKMAVADYFGISPKNKTDLDLLVELADEGGVCMHPDNMVTFLRVWMNPTEDTHLVVLARKAIRLGVIEQKTEQGRTDYYLGTAHIGTTVDDIVTYFRNNPTIYSQHIVREVAARDITKYEQKATKELAERDGTEPTQSDLQNLRTEAKKLKDEGFVDKGLPVHLMKHETLLPIVQEAREKKEKALV